MPYDGKILSRAMARFDEDKQRRARQFRERQQQLFAREPELADIDRRLRGTMSQIITRALKGGRDPVPAIHAIQLRSAGVSFSLLMPVPPVPGEGQRSAHRGAPLPGRLPPPGQIRQ